MQVTAQPTVTLTANGSTDTGRNTYVQSVGAEATTKISATADGIAVSATGHNVTAITALGAPATQSAVSFSYN